MKRFEFRGKISAGEEWEGADGSVFPAIFGRKAPRANRILKIFAKCLDEIGIRGGKEHAGNFGAGLGQGDSNFFFLISHGPILQLGRQWAD